MIEAEPRWWREKDSGNLLPKTYIFLKIQLILKERPEDTGQQPGYIHTRENPAPREGGKIQAPAQQDLRPLNPAPSRRRGVGAGRGREPRTAKHPAPAIHTRAQTQCIMGSWIVGKQDSKTFEQVPKPAPLGQRKVTAF